MRIKTDVKQYTMSPFSHAEFHPDRGKGVDKSLQHTMSPFSHAEFDPDRGNGGGQKPRNLKT